MRALLLLLLAPLSWGQFSVTFTHLPTEVTERIFANGKDLAIYQVAICSDDPTMPMSLPRERVLAAAPQIPVIANVIAEDLLQRKADASGWAVTKRVGSIVIQYAPLGLTAYGLATGTPNLTKIGFSSSLGMDVLKLAASRASARAPDPGKYFSMLLPDVVILGGNGCQTFLAAAGGSAKDAVVGPVQVRAPDRVAQRGPVDPDVLAVWKAE